MSKETVTVVDVVGGTVCVSVDDGQRVYSAIATIIHNSNIATISFSGVERMTTAFLNAAIGQLYGEFSEDQIRRSVGISDASPADAVLIKKVVDRAKKYFAEPGKYGRIQSAEDGNK